MADLLSTVKSSLDSLDVSQTPIVDSALKLINSEGDFSERLPKIMELRNQAIAKGGDERKLSGYILESLYASVSADEWLLIQTYNASQA